MCSAFHDRIRGYCLIELQRNKQKMFRKWIEKEKPV